MATYHRPAGAADEVGLRALMAGSPESRAHMSVAAQASFLAGISALLAAPFSPLFAVASLLALLAVCSGFVGMITTRGPDIAGSALSAVGLFAGLVAAGLVGLRYLGLDTAFGDELLPVAWDQLLHWSSMLPQPAAG